MKKLHTNVIGKTACMNPDFPQAWKLKDWPFGYIVAAFLSKDNSVKITVTSPLSGTIAEMFLVNVLLDPPREVLDKVAEPYRAKLRRV